MPELADILHALDGSEVRFCLLRGGMEEGAPGVRREVDLFVAREDAARFDHAVESWGFVRLPGWGYAPHRSVVAYEAARGWLKLDAVTDFCFGRRVKHLRIGLAEECLARRLGPSGGHLPAPEHELVLLLLHCLLDKGVFPARHRARIEAIGSRAAADADLAGRLTACFARHLEPALGWEEAAAAIAAGDWPGLLARRRAVARQLGSREPLASVRRWASARILLALRPLLVAARRRGRSVAIVGPDGAGKSTLARALAGDPELRARVVYMGWNGRGSRSRGSSERGSARGSNGRRSSARGSSARGRSRPRAARFAFRLVVQWARAALGFYHRLRGRLVVYDRHPWEGLGAASAPRGWGRALRRGLIHRSAPRPDVVVVLDAPGAVLNARKGEHGAGGLEAQRRRYLALPRRLPQAVVIDATAGREEVAWAATALLFDSQRRRTGRGHGDRRPSRS